MPSHPRLLVLVLVLATSVPIAAQIGPCPFGDDGFKIGCCQPANPNLPQFLPIQSQAEYACITSCGPTSTTIGVTIGPPAFFLCDYAVAPFTASLPGGATVTGPLLMKYARTWMEMGTTGVPRQVWRFLVNGDLAIVASSISVTPCPLPPCGLPPHNLPVHWVGHVDYACGPSATALQAAFSLTHLVGCISHGPFSSRPLAAGGHASTSYHIVGPAPFTFGPVAEPSGPIIDDAVRSSRLRWIPFDYDCLGEGDIQGGQLTTQMSGCLCSPTLPITGPYKHQSLSGTICCGGSLTPFHSVPVPGTPFPTGFVAQTLGAYGGPAGTFPGTRELTIYVGVLYSPESCTNVPGFDFHIVTGVASSGVLGMTFANPAGFCGPVILPVPTAWIDLQNMLDLGTASSILGPLPGIGSLFGSTKVWNLNTP